MEGERGGFIGREVGPLVRSLFRSVSQRGNIPSFLEFKNFLLFFSCDDEENKMELAEYY